ncbi:MAG: hypothetical protein AAF639_41210 [Chloroflexota bacterium]
MESIQTQKAYSARCDKAEVTRRAEELIENHFKPTYIKEMPPDYEWNYIIDIHGKWYRNYYYFSSTYHVSGPNAIRPTFESKFARMEYVAPDSYTLAFMRHTEKWAEVAYDCTLDESLGYISGGAPFLP